MPQFLISEHNYEKRYNMHHRRRLGEKRTKTIEKKYLLAR